MGVGVQWRGPRDLCERLRFGRLCGGGGVGSILNLGLGLRERSVWVGWVDGCASQLGG